MREPSNAAFDVDPISEENRPINRGVPSRSDESALKGGTAS